VNYYNNPPGQSGNAPAWQGEKERGGCLTAWLVVVTAFNLFFGLISSLQLLSYVGDPRVTRVIPAVVIYGLIGLEIALIAGLFGIWNWKRWGVYTVAGALAISAVFSLILGDALRGLVFPIIQFAIFFYLINPKWDYFD
jgi:O-antigen ligase